MQVPTKSGKRIRTSRLAVAILLAGLTTTTAVVALPAQTAGAATQTVTNCNDSGPGSLRQAVLGAASGDTVSFALSPSCSTITLTSGAIDVATDITIDGPGATILAVSGDDASPVFDVVKNVTAAISGLTIENGKALGYGFIKAGGGIVNSGSLALSDATVSDNSADIGAGISNDGTLTVTGSTFTGNNSTQRGSGSGGALDNDGTATIIDSTLSGNKSGSGGAIDNVGSLTIASSTLSGNTAGPEGGGISNDGTVVVTNSSISDNTANEGGGISNAGAGPMSTVTITASTLSGNSTSGYGGGIDNGEEGAITIANSTLEGNAARRGGGGIENYGVTVGPGTVTVTNGTLVANTAGSGVGDDIGNGGTGGTAILEATVVAEGAPGHDCSGITDAGYNIDDDGSCGFTATSVSDSATLDSTLGPLGANGGPTETVALLPGSPAIDKLPTPDCPATDQRGDARTAPCDIGAYDTDGTVNVTNCNDSGQGSLRQAAVGAAPGDTVAFALSPACSTITLTSGPIVVNRNLFIAGPGGTPLAVSGGAASTVIDVDSDVQATISELTIEDGSAPASDGGGIENSGTLTITHSTLSGNHAETGGAVANTGSVTIVDSTLAGNGATASGGGVANGTGGGATVISSTFSDNSAPTGAGVANLGTGSVSLHGTIVARSTGADCSGVVSDGGSNIDDDGTCVSGGEGSIKDSPSLDGDLGALGENGGPTETIALLPGSPAIDQVPVGDCPATDQRGATRTAPCDIGAYDTDGTPTITKIQPAKGHVGKRVVITGTNLLSVTLVAFHGTPATITKMTATTITTAVPVGATTGTITVSTAVGVTATSTASFKVK